MFLVRINKLSNNFSLVSIKKIVYHQADVIISQHFSLLTEQFLQPLQRYFTTLLPTEISLSEPERTRSFNSDVFLKSLKEHTTALEFRSRLAAGFNGSMFSIPGFYTSFLRSPNFSAWLHCQVDLADLAVRKRYLLRLQSSPFHHWSNIPHSSNDAHVHRFVNDSDAESSSRSYSTAPKNIPNQNKSSSIMRSNSSRITADKQSRVRGPKKRMNLSWAQSVSGLNQASEAAIKNLNLNKT